VRAIAGALTLVACGMSAAGPVSAAPQAAPAAPVVKPVLIPAPVTSDAGNGLILTAVPAPALPDTKPVQIPGREWRGDDDFYAAVVAYDRAELAWRRFRNRLCALPEPKRTSLSHVVNDVRERLDVVRSKLDMLWPAAPVDRLRFLARTDPEPQRLCADPVAAEEAFQAALAGQDGIANLIRLIERTRRPQEQH
jgi:hypothetical protein